MVALDRPPVNAVHQKAAIRLAGHPDAKEAAAVLQKRPPRYGQPPA